MKKRLIIIIVILIIIAAGAYFLSGFFKVEVSSDSVAATANESRGIVERVSKLVILPEGENPVVATVNDLRPLADKPFFKNAKVGYKLLIYEKAGRGVLYDPVKNRVVEMASISLGKLPE